MSSEASPEPRHVPQDRRTPGAEGAETAETVARSVGAPLADLHRSPAAWAVAGLAHRRGLFLFDYEARVQLELPEHWIPASRPDLGVTGAPPGWHRGQLAESKYLSFRHDLLLGSLHAGHRAKWSAHELCHGLVGFAWRTDASVLFHALAARLAEALPVALWYFFDESGLPRCERHARQVELGPGYCRDCERAQERGPREITDADRDFVLRGRRFLSAELAAIRETAASGRPVYTPHGGIDLMTDGLDYASAHLPRLRSPEMASFIAHFFPTAGDGRFDELEAMIAHVEALGEYLADAALGVVSEPPPALRSLVIPRPREVFIAQDLGQRLLQVAAETEGDCHEELMRLVARLGDQVARARANDGGVVGAAGSNGPAPGIDLASALEDYRALHEDWELPDPDAFFAVGYPLPGGLGLSREQILDGLESACGTALEGLRAVVDVDALVDDFLAAGTPSRRPLARRFCGFVQGVCAGVDTPEPDGSAGDARDREALRQALGLMRLEVAIAGAEPPDAAEMALGFDAVDLDEADTLTLARGVELVRCGFDAGGLLMVGRAALDGPQDFLVRRDAGDQVGLVAISARLATRLEEGTIPALAALAEAEHDPELLALVEEGMLVAARHGLATH